MKISLFQFYYLLTPVFFLIEWKTDMDIRVSGILTESQTYLYFAFCCACAVICFAKPNWESFVAFFESVINITLLLASVFLTSITIAESTTPTTFGIPNLINFLIAGSILLAVFYSSQRRIFCKRGD